MNRSPLARLGHIDRRCGETGPAGAREWRSTAQRVRNFIPCCGEEEGVHYVLEVHGLKDVTKAHLHVGSPDENGELVVWPYPFQPPGKLLEGVSNGDIAEGTITASDLTGPMKGKSVKDLVAKMSAGGLYVNVHTQQDPKGELRGQVHRGG